MNAAADTRSQAAIFDIDGVVQSQGRVYPSAVVVIHSLRQGGIRQRILTISTPKSISSAAKNPHSKGFTIQEIWPSSSPLPDTSICIHDPKHAGIIQACSLKYHGFYAPKQLPGQITTT